MRLGRRGALTAQISFIASGRRDGGLRLPEWDIARVVGIDTGHVKATAKVAEFLFRRATTEGPQAVTAAIFWLKTRGAWRETPQDHRIALADVRSLTDEELERLIAADIANKRLILPN